MRPLGVYSPLLVFVSPVTRRLQRVLTPAWTTLRRMFIGVFLTTNNEEPMRSVGKIKRWEKHVWSSRVYSWQISDLFYSSFNLLTKSLNKMNALPVSNLHRATATRFWRGTARRGRVSWLLFRFRQRNWSKVGLETWKCSFHCLCISALFSISLCQYCRRGYTHKDFCEPLGLLAFAAGKLAGAWWIKIRGCLETSDLETSDPRSPLGLRFLGLRFLDTQNTPL